MFSELGLPTQARAREGKRHFDHRSECRWCFVRSRRRGSTSEGRRQRASPQRRGVRDALPWLALDSGRGTRESTHPDGIDVCPIPRVHEEGPHAAPLRELEAQSARAGVDRSEGIAVRSASKDDGAAGFLESPWIDGGSMTMRRTYAVVVGMLVV